MKHFDKLPYRFLTGMDIIITPESDTMQPSSDQIYYAQTVQNHPQYIELNQVPVFDITIIVVDRPIKFGPLVSPICLPNLHDQKLFLNQKAKAVGKFN